VKIVCGHDICLQCFQRRAEDHARLDNPEQCCICRVNLFDTGVSEPAASEAPAAQLAPLPLRVPIHYQYFVVTHNHTN
jgi:hypothetical protein